MLGKGLESLIPRKSGDSGTPAPGASSGFSDSSDNSQYGRDDTNNSLHTPPTDNNTPADTAPFKLHDEDNSVPAPDDVYNTDDMIDTEGVDDSPAPSDNAEPTPEPASEPIPETTPEPEPDPEPTLPAIQRTRDVGNAVFQIEVEKIKPNPHQPRKEFDELALKELAGSIREFGVIQPLVVTKIEIESDLGSDVEYELVAGERRLRASKLAGLKTVPVVVRGTQTAMEKLEVAIIENIQRSDLNPIEQAKAFSRLQDEFHLTQREIATRLGKSREGIANSVRLLGLPQDIQNAISDGVISGSQAMLLLSVNDIAEQKALFDEIVGKKLTVREIKTKIARKKQAKSFGRSSSPETSALKEKLEEFLGTRVDLREEGDSGKIMINFYSKEELQGILDRMFGRSE